jgi:predicted kinase
MFRMIDGDAVELIEDEPVQETVIKEVTHQDLIEALNLDTLTLRKARPVAKALDIRQKVNGKDVPVKLLRAKIKQRLQGEPNLLPVVYEVLEIPFPEGRERLSA